MSILHWKFLLSPWIISGEGEADELPVEAERVQDCIHCRRGRERTNPTYHCFKYYFVVLRRTYMPLVFTEVI